MKNSIILTLVSIVTLTGCATLGGNPTLRVNDAVDEWVEALVEKDLDDFMEVYSEDFRDYEYGDKAGVAAFMAQQKSMGYLDDLKVDRSEEVIEVDGDSATVGPIRVSGYFGQATINLGFANESGDWRIVEQDIYGI